MHEQFPFFNRLYFGWVPVNSKQNGVLRFLLQRGRECFRDRDRNVKFTSRGLTFVGGCNCENARFYNERQGWAKQVNLKLNMVPGAASRKFEGTDFYSDVRSLFVDNKFYVPFSGIGSLSRYFYRCFQVSSLLLHRGQLRLHRFELAAHRHPLPLNFVCLAADEHQGLAEEPYLEGASDHQKQIESPSSPISPIPLGTGYRHGGKFGDTYGMLSIFLSLPIAGLFIVLGGLRLDRGLRRSGWCLIFGGIALDVAACVSGAIGCLPWDWWRCLHDGQEHSKEQEFHGANTVSHKYRLTSPNYCNTLISIGRAHMANVLSTDKQIAVISALAEGSSIRSIERITGAHRDTIMRLGVRVGQGCARVLDVEMRNLPCRQLQFDEIWGFIGKKERHCTPDDSLELGDVWTFCAIDSDTKLVPSFKVGKRDLPTANAFVADVASRMRNRVQISSDALRAYVDAVEMNFGADVDFAQIIKTYITDDSHIPERRFSAPEIVVTEKKSVSGFPDLRLASTSHVERLNGTTRLHMRRLTRLTYAFSKKLENFEAAVALHFAYYNLVKRHGTLRCTPAMAAGIERSFWSVGQLLEAAA